MTGDGDSVGTGRFSQRVSRVRADWIVWYTRALGALVAVQTVEDWVRPGWRALYVDAPVRIPLPGLEALQLHGLLAMQALFATLLVSALCVFVGRGGRIAQLVMALALLVEFAQDAAHYLNHHYLIVLLSLVATLMPPVRLGGDASADALWLVRFQLSVPYVFAGIAKLDPDWISGRVMQKMLDARESTLGPLVTQPGQAPVMAWAALALDLLAPVALWSGRGRAVAWTALVVFHLANSGLYDIGVFPWAMLTLTPILLPDDTLARMWATWRSGEARRVASLAVPALGCAMVAAAWSASPHVPELLAAAWAGNVLGWVWFAPTTAASTDGTTSVEATKVDRALPRMLLGAWVVAQVLVPLRHWWIPGDVAWTEQGHRYAWRMLLRTKRVEQAVVEVVAPVSGHHWYLAPGTLLQAYQVQEILTRPDLAQAFAREVAAKWARDGKGDVEVRLRVVVSLNGHPSALLLDPNVDLVRAPSPWWSPTPWVLPTPRRMWW